MTAPFIQDRLKHQDVSPRPFANLERTVCKTCHGKSAANGEWCDTCFGLPYIYRPRQTPHEKRVQQMFYVWLVIAGIVAAILFGGKLVHP